MTDSLELSEVLPTFISSSSATSALVYFHHVVDPETATLTVQVLGANLTFKFRHTRARRISRMSHIGHQLENKTTGFLALVGPSSKRIVLAAAESGHGAGRFGDLLDPQQGILANAIWTKRVIAIGKVLGLKMNRPFDGMGRVPIAKLEGIFLGSHVEVKLAVHGICVLLNMFGITKNFDNITMNHLRQLRTARWEDGSRPVFEVYFSRKHCHPCRSLVQKLEQATGITIKLLWKHRLVMKTYKTKTTPVGPPKAGARPAPEPDSQDFDFGDVLPDDSDVEVISDDEEDEAGSSIHRIDLTNLRSTSPIELSEEINSLIDDALIDGLAYRVGQMETSPDGATAAIVEFVESVQSRKRPPVTTRQNPIEIDKPLPATPVTEEPAHMLDSARHTWPQRTLFTRDPGRQGVRSARARSASPSSHRRSAIRERSPRRYHFESSERAVLNRGRARTTPRPRPRKAYV
ncbi:hypothetical protein FALBO_4882 [Fusarium albosuccineum]|uniref:Uncharacterized protein n=1 Tax=Fusarium albosuccineum TaxID=1237068 RepID=A0A8H4LHK7_9HYPO|nr:hypothetical protein FALBO_4882 [Fusarium albosuccineum]